MLYYVKIKYINIFNFLYFKNVSLFLFKLDTMFTFRYINNLVKDHQK